MARLFTAASSESAQYTTAAPITAVPLTLVAWINNASNPSVTRRILTIKDKDSADGRNAWYLSITTSRQIQATAASGSGVSNSTTAGAATNGAWAHAGAVFSANNNRVAYLDGAAATAETTSRIPSGTDCVVIGSGLDSGSTISRPFDGDIAEAAVYNVALTDAEIAMLAAGYSPLMVRPDALVCYWPIIGKNSPETDIVGQYNLTLTGTAASAHPRIIRPSAKILTFPSAGGGSLNVSATTDALALAEYAATIGKDLSVSATTDALTLAEYAATVSLSRNISATTDALTLAEYPATIGLALNIAATTDALTLTEYAATLGSVTNVQATTDALTLAEYPATIGLALNVSATTDSLTLVEYGATIGDGSVAPAAATGGVGHGRKRKKRRVMVDGYVYVVDPEQERVLLARLAQEKAQEAQLLEALGDPQTAAVARRKAFRIARRADMADPYERIRKDDEEVISRFIGLLAA